MSYRIRKGVHDTLVISTLGPEKHHPIKEKIASPVIEVAIPFDTETKEFSFTVMRQSNHDPTFSSHGCQQNPFLIGEKREADLTCFGMKHTEGFDGVNELDGKLCVDPTKAFLISTPYAGQLPPKFEPKCVYTIRKMNNEIDLEYLLTDEAKARPLHELNNLFQCCRIDGNSGVSTPVSFNEMNHIDYHWLQLDGICMSVFYASIKWKVAPLHPMSSPALIINEDGHSFIPAIRADGIYYRRNYISNLVMTVMNGVR